MSFSQDNIWVKTCLLRDAVKTSGDQDTKTLLENYIEERDDHWDWSQAIVVKGNLLKCVKDEEDLTLLIVDCENHYEILVPIKVIKKYASESGNNALVMANSEDVSGPPDNLVNLAHLHAPALVHALKTRFEDEQIYTSTGSILLAVNPFQKFDELYDSKTMRKYMEHHKNTRNMKDDGNGTKSLPPHVYAIADDAFRSMRRGLELMSRDPSLMTCDQSILISGESGAGKTVTTKHIMNYIAHLSPSDKEDSSTMNRRPQLNKYAGSSSRSVRTSRRMSRVQLSTKFTVMIQQKILESNPTLESFGNACTIRNDNSSRFGKYIELQFDKKSGNLVGAKIDTYLLEKVRLIHLGEGDRNYHVFYETLAAADKIDRERYFLEQFTAEDFKLTNQSGVYDRRDEVDDLDQFDDLVVSMNKIGFNENDQEGIFELICALLHASNITFTTTDDDEDSALNVDSVHLQYTVDLLGVTVDALSDALCVYYITVGKERYQRRQSKQKAEKGLEALMKAIYSALFEYLVNEVNTSINSNLKEDHLSHIGVLDIFGFESFKTNSLEQLCINYCNEALQQQFNFYVFKSEQDEYKAEGVSWDFIEFPDNQDVLDLIETKSTGLISILDDQCRVPGATDKTFANRLYVAGKEFSRFEANHRQVGSNMFGIKHFAGCVEYNITGFIEKNKDEVPREMIDFLECSSKPLLKVLAMRLKNHSGAPSPESNVRLSRKTSRITVGGHFKAQLQLLRQRIDRTSPHYIRCLKPNSQLVPETFMSQMISDQLESAGVLEAIRVSRVGYPQRFSHEQFFNQYHFLGGKQMFSPMVKSNDLRSKCEIIINAVESSQESSGHKNNGSKEIKSVPRFQLGKTKVFLRQSAFNSLEHQRVQSLENSLVSIQSVIRRYLAQKMFEDKMEKVIFIQSIFRMRLAKRQMTRLLLQAKLKERKKTMRLSNTRTESLLLKFSPVTEDEETNFNERPTKHVPTFVGISENEEQNISRLSMNSAFVSPTLQSNNTSSTTHSSGSKPSTTQGNSLYSLDKFESIKSFHDGKRVVRRVRTTHLDSTGRKSTEIQIVYSDGSSMTEMHFHKE